MPTPMPEPRHLVQRHHARRRAGHAAGRDVAGRLRAPGIDRGPHHVHHHAGGRAAHDRRSAPASSSCSAAMATRCATTDLGGLQVAFGAQEYLRRNLAAELGRYGVRVLTIQTGGIPDSIPDDFAGKEAIAALDRGADTPRPRRVARGRRQRGRLRRLRLGAHDDRLGTQHHLRHRDRLTATYHGVEAASASAQHVHQPPHPRRRGRPGGRRHRGAGRRRQADGRPRGLQAAAGLPDGRPQRREPAPPSQDLRTPDTLPDYADGRGTYNAPEVIVVKQPVVQPTADSMDWADIGLGAGSVMGLSLIALGGGLLIVRRRGAQPARQLNRLRRPPRADRPWRPPARSRARPPRSAAAAARRPG